MPPQVRTPFLMQPTDGIFPGPFAAVMLTLAAVFATALVFTLLGELHFIARVGISQVVGLGAIAALAARRVPPPHEERIGLRGFSPRLIVPLLCLLPVTIVVSEIDNWVRVLRPPPPEIVEMTDQLIELTRIDSLYAAVQTVIVAVGISPVVEGFFYFGVVLQGLVARMGRLPGALATAALYSIAHFPASGAPGDAIVPLASALILGSLLALARLGSGSVLAAMSLAGAFAAVHLLARDLAEEVPIAGFNAGGDHTPATIVVPSLLAVLYGGARLWRRASIADPNPPIPPPGPRYDEDEEGGFFL
jgi:membrane protease YdiL (CAAX protease family)